MDTLKEILSDINLHCHVKPRENLKNPGYTILASETPCLTEQAQKRHSTTFSRSTDKLFYPMSYGLSHGLTLLKQRRNYALNHKLFQWFALISKHGRLL